MAEKNNIILCDTNVIIETFRNNKVVIDELEKIGYDNITISVITVAELLFGARNKQEFLKIKKRIDKISIIPVNTGISDIFHKLIEDYSLSHSIGIPDSFIAATAIHYTFELFTFNTKDFKFIPVLRIYNYANTKGNH